MTMVSDRLTDEQLAEILSGAVDGMEPTTQELAMAAELQEMRKNRQREDKVTQEYPEMLPCPVHLVPGLRFGKGCKTEGLLIALQRRAEYYAELDAMTPEERAKHYANIEAFKAMLPQPAPVAPEDLRRSFEAVARLNNEMYRWTSCMSYNGSYVGEPEGLLKRNIREIEHIMDACRAAMLQGGAK